MREWQQTIRTIWSRLTNLTFAFIISISVRYFGIFFSQIFAKLINGQPNCWIFNNMANFQAKNVISGSHSSIVFIVSKS